MWLVQRKHNADQRQRALPPRAPARAHHARLLQLPVKRLAAGARLDASCLQRARSVQTCSNTLRAHGVHEAHTPSRVRSARHTCGAVEQSPLTHHASRAAREKSAPQRGRHECHTWCGRHSTPATTRTTLCSHPCAHRPRNNSTCAMRPLTHAARDVRSACAHLDENQRHARATSHAPSRATQATHDATDVRTQQRTRSRHVRRNRRWTLVERAHCTSSDTRA